MTSTEDLVHCNNMMVLPTVSTALGMVAHKFATRLISPLTYTGTVMFTYLSSDTNIHQIIRFFNQRLNRKTPSAQLLNYFGLARCVEPSDVSYTVEVERAYFIRARAELELL